MRTWALWFGKEKSEEDLHPPILQAEPCDLQQKRSICNRTIDYVWENNPSLWYENLGSLVWEREE
jgi:hypothetical protein